MSGEGNTKKLERAPNGPVGAKKRTAMTTLLRDGNDDNLAITEVIAITTAKVWSSSVFRPLLPMSLTGRDPP